MTPSRATGFAISVTVVEVAGPLAIKEPVFAGLPAASVLEERGKAVLVGARAVFFVRGTDLVDCRSVELVFVVEDEPHVAEALETCLSESGYLVRSFSNGGQALKCAAKHAPDAVICEAEMSRMDGFSLGREMRVRNPRCKVLLLTEGGTAHDDFILLQKPVGLNALLEVLVDDLLATGGTKL